MRKGLKEALTLLNIFLDGNNFVCGNTVTIADIFILNTLLAIIVSYSMCNQSYITFSNLNLLFNFFFFKHAGAKIWEYPNIPAWYERCKHLPGFEESDIGGAEYGNRVKENLNDEF